MIIQTKNGRSVVADRNYRKGARVEICEILFVPISEINDTGIIAHYVFWWNEEALAIALGNGSLYNHSDSPNMDVVYLDTQLEFKAICPIKKGDELTFCYTSDYSRPRFLSKQKALFARTGNK